MYLSWSCAEYMFVCGLELKVVQMSAMTTHMVPQGQRSLPSFVNCIDAVCETVITHLLRKSMEHVCICQMKRITDLVFYVAWSSIHLGNACV